MPLRDDLLTPIAGENPSGEDLYYDRIFDQIKEARREDADDLPEGDWERTQKKKADHRAVIKLAGEAMAKRSKDIRLAGWLVEAHLRVEGFPVLVPGIELLRTLQETFWETLFPPIEEGGDLELRMLSVEAAARLIAAAARKAPLTRSGLNHENYLESRIVGYERDATSDAKLEARKDALDHGKISAEDFDSAFVATPKSLYTAAEATLAESIASAELLDSYGQETYGDLAPNLSPLRSTLEEIHQIAALLLNERRKTEPDPVTASSAPATPSDAPSAFVSEDPPDEADTARAGPQRTAGPAQLNGVADAYALVVESAVFLFDRNPQSPVPYLVCAGLRLGETRMQGAVPAPGFAVGPGSEVRQSLRSMANRGAWKDLLRASLPILASECARSWLDLHRYIFQASQETGAEAIAMAVAGTVRGLLAVQPELRNWTLEDDTGAANPETQRWLDATVLQ
jgi:type VI secretion system protein ImpA